MRIWKRCAPRPGESTHFGAPTRPDCPPFKTVRAGDGSIGKLSAFNSTATVEKPLVLKCQGCVVGDGGGW